MPLKLETIDQFLGFGDGKRRGEYYYSQGMKLSRMGIKPGWVMVENVKDGAALSTTTTLHLITWFNQRDESGTVWIYAVANDGKVYKVAQGLATWDYLSGFTVSGYGNGMGVDTEKNIVIAGKQYLGKIALDGTKTNNWKDLGVDETAMWRPIERYEDTMVIGCKNSIATYTGDGTDFCKQTFAFPDGFIIRAMKSGRTGILIGMNFEGQGILALWDNYSDRAIAPWIWLKEQVLAIAQYDGKWIVAVGDEFILTDGYTTQHLCYAPDTRIQGTSLGTKFTMSYSPGCMVVKNHYLLVAGGGAERNRIQQGVWVYDLETRLWEFCAVSNDCTYTVGIGGIFVDSAYHILVGYVTSTPNNKYVGWVRNAASTTAFFITNPIGKGDNRKIPEGLILNIGYDLFNPEYASDPDWEITAKIFDFKRQLWLYGETKVISPSTDEIVVNASLSNMNHAEIGDEITISDGVNAGEVRHILSVSGAGTSTETWTLDSDLNSLTEANVLLIISPFKKIATKTLNTTTIKNNLYYFPIKDAPDGKKFLIKILIKGATDMIPEISSLSFLYNDLGYL